MSKHGAESDSKGNWNTNRLNDLPLSHAPIRVRAECLAMVWNLTAKRIGKHDVINDKSLNLPYLYELEQHASRNSTLQNAQVCLLVLVQGLKGHKKKPLMQ